MFTFGKAERLYRRSQIERLFSTASHSFFVAPLRVIYLRDDELDVPASILISVSKRHFKRAVKRNRVKRQIREAYRLNKELLSSAPHLLVAFVYQSDDILPSSVITESVKTALQKLSQIQGI
jgi:ribonuclease P protein component